MHIDTIPVMLDGVANINKPLTLLLVSRRSRHRAGTRYKRRGVDELGYVANYVETEQCLLFGDHVLSFVQVRGSVPVFWSQPGFKYRPPPQIDRGKRRFYKSSKFVLESCLFRSRRKPPCVPAPF